MNEMIKKLGVSFWLLAVTVVLAVVGFITVLMANATQGYAISNLGLNIAAVIVAAVCVLGVAYFSASGDCHSIIVFALSAVAVVLFMYAFSNVLINRAELASALFTYDAVNTVGWGVFYKSVVAMVCCLASAIIVTVNAFIAQNND